MPLDPYSPCPGGTGKKIKFCCVDLTAELDKVERMIEGEQFVACRDHVTKLDEKYPGRPCLLSWKLLLEQMTGDRQKAAGTLTAFIAQHPNNPIALAETALVRVQEGDVRGGIAFLQSALEASVEQLHERVYAAIGAMGEILVLGQQILPARAHLMLQMMFSRGADERAVQILLRLENTPGVPVLLKDMPQYAEPPADPAWRDAFIDALRLASRGWWRAAEERWRRLIVPSGDSPSVWKNLAIVRANLADTAGAVEALRKYAALDVPLDDAIEAEGLAQLLDRENAEGTVDSLLVTFAVGDADELERRLASDKQADRTEFDSRAFAEAEQPPPRGVFWLLDRPLVASAAELPRDQIPQILGQALLFGKQTDRQARLELDVFRSQLAPALDVLHRIAGDALGEQQGEEVTGRASAVERSLSLQWRLPYDMSEPHRRKVIADERRAMLLDRWPSLPLPLLGGKSASEATADPANRVRLLAAILVLEASEGNPAMAGTFDELRRRLGLPLPQQIDPTGSDINTARLVRFPRFSFENMSDEQSRQAFERAQVANYRPALVPAARELSRREAPELFDFKLAAYHVLAQNEEQSERALEWIEAGRKAAEQGKRSSAPWDLQELDIRIEREEGQKVVELLQHIHTEHGREPHVAEALYGVYARLGMIGPDGRVRIPAAAAQQQPGIVVPGAAAEPGKLWTPDSESAGTKKSGLWVPE